MFWGPERVRPTCNRDRYPNRNHNTNSDWHCDFYPYGDPNTPINRNASESSTPTRSLSEGNERRQPGLILWNVPPRWCGESETLN